MKHGPIALLEDGSPVIFIVPNDHVKENLAPRFMNAVLGAKIILIHEQGDDISDEGDVNIAIPKVNNHLSAMLSVYLCS